ncbi:DNA polymerase-4 [Jezberella montanilacus]|uniref:DNA polymerase IV n=1 Tax=Jezberella montanilacus TaxID=323426 RepID=A0A2T0XDT7_9BURK|nr:DNA polymerase IV [Jezberella montanilacus]PRY97104.1 DNA polymerase-4 [Jezberella montanilacus]
MRRIAHLDMDAFFASVELLTYPDLKGRPVVVGGRNASRPTMGQDGGWLYPKLKNYAGRGVVTTSTYEARALGVFSGMGLMKSAELAPEAVLLPGNYEAYRHYSRLFKSAVASVAPIIEDRGIDEIYIDLTDLLQDSIEIATQIKLAVREATGLSCSIGITPNKLLSKIASDLDKPDGITILSQTDLEAKIWPLAAKKINGIGPKATEKLKNLEIHTIGELARTEVALLIEHFGQSTGLWMNRAAHGLDDRPVVTESEPRSISRETTFVRDLHVKTDRNELSEIFTSLCTKLSEDLRRKAYASKTLGVKLKYADFRVVTRDISVPHALFEAADIRRTAQECLKRVPLEQKIRLIGVKASNLIPIEDLSQAEPALQADLPFDFE